MAFIVDNNIIDDEYKKIVKYTKCKYIYNLIGLIYHSGLAAGGHYYTIIKRDKKWYIIDDSPQAQIKELDGEEKKQWEKTYKWKEIYPYLLFYTRKEDKMDVKYKPENYLQNYNNSCWLNALLQILFNIDEIRNYILSD